MNRQLRIKRHKKIRRKIFGTSNRPRLAVFRSSQHIYAEIIDDQTGKTLAEANDLQMKKEPKTKKAYEVGQKLAAKALKLKIKQVVFDRGGFLYNGRVENLAKGAREGGLKI